MHCHDSSSQSNLPTNGTIALIGHPNVGKSVIFQQLTGQHAVVANYPGTTVEVSRGQARLWDAITLVDTPGVVTFPPHTDDEKVTEKLLLEEPVKTILQVGDAKNLCRTLLLTIQLAEMGTPMVLALNMMDEARTRGVRFNHEALGRLLNLPVILTTAIRGEGVKELSEVLETALPTQLRIDYPSKIETALSEFCLRIREAPIDPRSLALLWLSEDPIAESWLKDRMDDQSYQELVALRQSIQDSFDKPLSAILQNKRLETVEQIYQSVILETGERWDGISNTFGHLTTHPLWGGLFLGLVLYLLYWFVGVFGAGTLVDLLETQLFGNVLNPYITTWISRFSPSSLFTDLLVGQYGVWTMGMTYALALILPIVTTFFLAFGVMEDSGYLPRLAALSNRIFKSLGLNGKAVLPMVLGLGCVTMATLTTRVLESKRERFLVTLLLALAIPCSAQLGVVMGLLAGISMTATLIWSGVVFGVLLLVGWLAARLMPGERNQLLVELPPLRWPMISNVILKTLARLEWYLKEVVPLFLLGTLVMFILDRIGILAYLTRTGEPIVTGWLGLPPETSAAFLMGFLRRDFGATGLFVMESQGLLNPAQVVVAMVTITLFIPCIASLMMIAKERSWKTAIAMSLFIFPLAFTVGGLLNRALILFGWGS